ncbi:MAG: hypothetical protein QNK23_12635 [Crocinitomicaceae bacterium]|nr:hypothetical protein [Crocinitomicaceae bacterium]
MKFFSSSSLLYLGLITLCFLFIYPFIFESKLFLGGDNANYYLLAKGLSEGEGYINYHFLNNIPANHFPPGYPFLMSLFMRIGIDSIAYMKMLNGLLLLISSYLFFHIAYRLSQNKILAFVLSILMLMNKHLLEYSTSLMSEIPFMCTLLLVLYLFFIFKDKDYSIKSPYFYFLIIALIFLIYLRTQGIAIFGALLLTLIISRQYKATIILFSLTLLAHLPWQMRSANLGGSGYMKQVMRVKPYDNTSEQMRAGDWAERVGENMARYVSKEIPHAIFPGISIVYKNAITGEKPTAPIIHWLIGFLIMIFTLLGIWSMKDNRKFFLLFIGITACLLLVWPQVWSGVRFLLPMIPFVLMFSVFGIIYMADFFRKSKENGLISSTKFAWIFSILALGFISQIKTLHTTAEGDYPRNYGNFFRMGTWCQNNLPEDAVIASRKPALFYSHYLGKCASFPYTLDREEFIRLFEESGATHLINEQLGYGQSWKYAFPVIQAEQDKFKLIHSFDAEIKKDAQGNRIPSTSAVWLFEFNPDLGYQGDYIDGLREGDGQYNYHNGSILTGHWENDTLQGPGVLTTNTGIIYKGNWVNGKKNGRFVLTDQNGTFESTWIDDVLNPLGYRLDEEGNRLEEVELN